MIVNNLALSYNDDIAFELSVFYFICDEISWKRCHDSNFRYHSTKSESTNKKSYDRI